MPQLYMAVVKSLVAHKANVTLSAADGMTAFKAATLHRRDAVLQLLRVQAHAFGPQSEPGLTRNRYPQIRRAAQASPGRLSALPIKKYV